MKKAPYPDVINHNNLPEAMCWLRDSIVELTRLYDQFPDTVSTNNLSSADSDIMVVDQATVFTSLSRQTIYSLVSKREIPYFKKGKRLYFSRIELANWIKEGRKKTKQEISDEAVAYLSKRGGRI